MRGHSLLLAPSLLGSVYASSEWTLKQVGTSGVNAMQLTVFDKDNVIFIDKLESNPLHDSKGQHALGAVYSPETRMVLPLNITTNSFCAGGGWLSNGTLVNIGGNQDVTSGGTSKPDGRQAIRMINSCKEGKGCKVYDDPQHVGLTSPRWYPSTTRLPDGSLFICGGSIAGDWTNNDNINNPTYEFFPPKNIHGYNGLQIPMQYLKDTMPHNLFPHVFSLPDGRLFMAANNKAMIFDWKTNTETRLPDLPNGQICTYPMSAIAVLLPLRAENGFQDEVLICGGSHITETDPTKLSAKTTPASDQCSRMLLTPDGIKKGWEVEKMPVPRIMPNAVLLPNGKVLIANGARTGTAGYDNVQDRVGSSNADNPVLQPVIYDPTAPAGQRFSSEGLPTSNIPRMYHSTMSMLPDGSIMIAGSNPNLDVETREYPTEYRVEKLSPPYILDPRPIISTFDAVFQYGRTAKAMIKLPAGLHTRGLADITAVIMDLGFSTHGVHTDQRVVMLASKPALGQLGPLESLVQITGPPNPNVYPPGPAFLCILVNGVLCPCVKVMVGDGLSPPVDQGAISNMLAYPPGPN